MTEKSVATLEIVDTNVLVYSVDCDEHEKQSVAQKLVEELLLAGRLAVSVQTLNEFYVTVTRRHRRSILSHVDAVAVLNRLVALACVLPLTANETIEALKATETHGMSYWDSLIWAVAKTNGVPTIHSEDFQHGRTIEGVTFSNPFVAAAG